MLAPVIRLAALLASAAVPAFADAVIDADAGRTDDLERTAAKRAEILASTDYARLGTCRDLVRDLYRWGVLDNLATGIGFGLINNATRIARRAEAAGDHRQQRASGDFVVGFCTATVHLHMADRGGARDRPAVVAPGQATGSLLQSRIARLHSRETVDPDRCRARIGELEDAGAIDQVGEAMLRLELDHAIEQGSIGAPSQGFGHGLCAAVRNAAMGAPG